MTNQSKDIAVFTNGEITGDGIVKIPFIVALKKAMHSHEKLSQGKLIWFCRDNTVYKNSMNELVKDLIDEIVILPSKKITLSEYLNSEKADNRNFYALIDTQMSLSRTLWLKRKFNYEIFVSPSCNHLFSYKKPQKTHHEKLIDMLLGLGEAVIGEKLQTQPVMITNPIWHAKTEKLLSAGNKYVGLVPGAGQPHKRWHIDNYFNLAISAQNKGYIPVIFTGPAEKEMIPLFKDKLTNCIIPFESDDLSTDKHAYSPSFAIALAQRLNAVIANDGGGGNIVFSASNVSAIGLFRAKSVACKYAPARSNFHSFYPEMFSGKTINDIDFNSVDKKLTEIL